MYNSNTTKTRTIFLIFNCNIFNYNNKKDIYSNKTEVIDI